MVVVHRTDPCYAPVAFFSPLRHVFRDLFPSRVMLASSQPVSLVVQ